MSSKLSRTINIQSKHTAAKGEKLADKCERWPNTN